VGIAEQHAVTFAAGLACEGLAPFCTIYSTFLQRGYDQVVHDVSLQKLPGAFRVWLGAWGWGFGGERQGRGGCPGRPAVQRRRHPRQAPARQTETRAR
jgi:hypothetical protein